MMHKQTLRPALAFTVLALAACSSTPVPRASVTSNVCDDCGRIVHVETVAAGNSKALGGIVGSVASKPLPGTYDYRIHVQLDNGQRTSVLRDELDGLEPGQRVRVSEGRLMPLP